MFALLLLSVSICHWSPLAELEPNGTTNALFGSATAIASGRHRIAVGAPHGAGAVHLFEFQPHHHDQHAGSHGWTSFPPLVPANGNVRSNGVDYNVTVFGLGTSVGISNDGDTIIAGAPGTTYEAATVTRSGVGAVVIFKKSSDGWSQSLSIPPELTTGGQYGALLDWSSDLKYFAVAASTDVFVANESGGWVPLALPNATENVTSLEFVDASTLLVARDRNVELYKRSVSGWRLRQLEWAPPNVTGFGRHVGMPENDQFTTAMLVSNTTGDSVVFMQRNDTTNRWEYLYEVPFPTGARGGQLDFCRDGLLASSGTTERGRAVFLFSRGRSGRFECADTI
jgi:hypothetical protein